MAAERAWVVSDMVAVPDPEFGTVWKAWGAVNYHVERATLMTSQSDPNTGAPINGYGVYIIYAEPGEIDLMQLDNKVDVIARERDGGLDARLSATPLKTAGVIARLEGRGIPVVGIDPNMTANAAVALVRAHIQQGRASAQVKPK